MPKFELENGSLKLDRPPIQKGRFEKAVYLPDLHCPYEDKTTLRVVFDFIRDFQPDRIFILGDWVDFYDLSSFDKSPERRFKLQKELDIGRGYLEDLTKIVPQAKKVFMQGNHEDRIRRWLWKNPDIASLRSLDIDELLGLDELGFESYEYHEVYNYNGFLIKHGDMARKHSGYSAKAELENDGVSGISGHTHRLGSHFKRDHSGQSVWFEAGCLCDLEPHYDVRPNWQQGLAYSYMERQGNRFFTNLVPIIKNRLLFNDILYS